LYIYIVDPGPIPQGKMKDAEPLIQVFGEKTVQSFYSKAWVLRESAVKTIESSLSTLEGDKATIVKNIVFILNTTLQDKITHVYYASLSLLKSMITGIAADMKKPALISMLGNIFSIIVEKTGDSNQKTKDMSAETILFLAAQPNIGATHVCNQILHKVKSQGWKPVIGRMELLISLIPHFGFGEENVPKAVIPYIVSVFDNPNQDARTAALLAITEAFKLDAKTTEMYTDKVKPQIKAILEEKFAEIRETMPKSKAKESNTTTSSRSAPSKEQNPKAESHKKEQPKATKDHAKTDTHKKEQSKTEARKEPTKSKQPPQEVQPKVDESEEEFEVER
jgi:hypothetical protein